MKVKLSKYEFLYCIIANTPLMRYRFLYIGADLCYLVLQPDTSPHCKTMNTG